MKHAPRFILLPGTGADGRLFDEHWDTLPGETLRVNWATCHGATTLEETAAILIRHHSIRETDTLVGISLGGMVASEIANRTRVSRLILLGSCIHPHGVSACLRAIHPLATSGLIRISQAALGRSPRLIHRMFVESDAKFIRDMIRAIFRWQGLGTETLPRPISLHSRGDWVIPLPADTNHTFEGGHMFMCSQAAACVILVKTVSA